MASQELRVRAEEAMQMSRRDFSALAALEAQQVLYELQVHQIELEMQNESLRTAQLDGERYNELFDHAPVGYLMLDASGVVMRANAAALRLLGVTRPHLLGQPFAASVASADLPVLDRRLTDSTPGRQASWEVRLRPTKGGATHVRIDTSSIQGMAGSVVGL